jgi:hypothetical protein
LRRWLDAAQKVLILLASTLLLRGQGKPEYWVALGLFVPALRLALARGEREFALLRFKEMQAQLEAYPTISSAIPWRAAFAFVTIPVLVLLSLSHSCLACGDTQAVMLTAASLVREGDCDLGEYRDSFAASDYSPDGRLPYFLQETRTGIYSAYPSGMVVFATPVAAAARCLGADMSDRRTRERLEKLTASMVAAACLTLFFLLALHRVSLFPAWVMTALLALGSTFYSTIGQLLWQHGGVILAALTLLFCEFRQQRRVAVALTVIQGLACALLIACRLSAGLFVLTFGIWLLVRAPRRALGLAILGAVFYTPWAWFYYTIYGSPLGPSTMQMEGRLWSPNLGSSFLGVLLSPARGLLIYQPWLLVLGVAAVVCRREPERSEAPRGWSVLASVYVLLHVALVSAWVCWWGGHCWGSRLASETVPFLALLGLKPLASLLKTAAGRRVVFLVAVLSALLHLPVVYAHADRWNAIVFRDQSPDQLWNWSDAPMIFPLRHSER